MSSVAYLPESVTVFTGWVAQFNGIALAGVLLFSAMQAHSQPAAEVPAARASVSPPSPAGSTPTASFADGIKAFDERRYDKAVEAWLPLAQQGRRAAQFNLAYLYENGLGVARDLGKAAHWYLAAAEQGDAESEQKIAGMYESGLGVDADPARAAAWYRRAAANPATDADSRTKIAAALVRVEDLVNRSAAGELVIPFAGGRFVIATSAAKDCVVALQGTVTKDAADGFDRVVHRAAGLGCNAPVSLLLESGGGSHYDGLRLGKKVRARGMSTIARYSCASACASIFLGGVERVLWGSRAAVGFHEVAEGWSDQEPSNAQCIDSRDHRAVREFHEYLQYVNPAHAERLFDIAMATSCKSIEWIHGQEALDLGVATRLEAEGMDLFGSEAARLPRH